MQKGRRGLKERGTNEEEEEEAKRQAQERGLSWMIKGKKKHALFSLSSQRRGGGDREGGGEGKK